MWKRKLVRQLNIIKYMYSQQECVMLITTFQYSSLAENHIFLSGVLSVSWDFVLFLFMPIYIHLLKIKLTLYFPYSLFTHIHKECIRDTAITQTCTGDVEDTHPSTGVSDVVVKGPQRRVPGLILIIYHSSWGPDRAQGEHIPYTEPLQTYAKTSRICIHQYSNGKF